ncbi:MAG: hypothetical protein N2484_08735 [Clostridia bacterium]|nr:hypothetical protein [Clostridia bacterium]
MDSKEIDYGWERKVGQDHDYYSIVINDGIGDLQHCSQYIAVSLF